MTIKIVKLISGEEVIARITNDRFTEVGNTIKLIALKDAFSFRQNIDSDGKASIEFDPWGSMVVGDIIIPYSYIMYSGDPSKNMKDAYMSAIAAQPENNSDGDSENKKQINDKLKSVYKKAKEAKDSQKKNEDFGS
jgi:hypothetical protein